MIRLVLFDIDGTLIHTSGAGEKAFARAFATQFGLENSTAGVNFAGRTDPGIVREILLRHQVEPSQENMGRFFDAYVFLLDHLLQQLPGGTFPGVWDWIQDLRALPCPPTIGLLTGNIRLGAEIKLRRFGLWQEFELGGFGDDHIERNEIAAVVHRRGERVLDTPLRGDQVLVVGDTPLDIACARHIQARVLGVATGRFSVQDLKAHHPDWAVQDLQQISASEVCA